MSAPHTADSRRPNRLIHEKSPYLLQHAYNPVDWYPWGAEALAKAKQEDKPIFLSIGYSTCYWCHVMEHESFENPAIAQRINASFVPIKVDREERPDLDALYMSAVTALSGQGGWPMTVFLTPDRQPFWGGTYFPPEDRWGRPGLPSVLQSIDRAWRTQRRNILQTSQRLTDALNAAAEANIPSPLTRKTLQTAAEQFTSQYDAVHGGFGPAPKFPRSHALSLLLRVWFRDREAKLLGMVESTLDAMARGGIHDHLGGGFHRYSTDEQWLVPHFEKMLYDQALLARTYLEAFQITGNAAYADTARGIFTYVLRDLRDPGGAFYAAEDAGEVGDEGAFYVWTPDEIDAALSSEDAALVNRVYGVTRAGSFEGHNILHLAQPLATSAAQMSLPVEKLAERLAQARATLLAARNQRTRPHRDDKILADWNGLMIGALAYGARVLNEPRYAAAATEAAIFLLEHMTKSGLVHRFRDGEAAIPGFLDDYAFVGCGLVELYEATGDARWLAQAKQLTEEMVRLFWDDTHGGFFMSGPQHEALIAKPKELYDGAVPSGNSMAALLLVRVGSLTQDEALTRRAEAWFRTYSTQIARMPEAVPQTLIALDSWLGPLHEVVIAGDPSSSATQQMVRETSRRFLPRLSLIHHQPGQAGAAIESLVPFVKAQQPLDGKPTAYVCQGTVCQRPTTDPGQMAAELDALR